MQLLIDSGATKALWVLVRDGREVRRSDTPGISPYFLKDEEIAGYALQVRRAIEAAPLELHFYGTGCQGAGEQQRLRHVLAGIFPEAAVLEVGTDILGAARGACGHQPGICAILGTGSNACTFDGTAITDRIGGNGYILGDEGSGAALGIALLNARLNRKLPPDLQEELSEFSDVSREAIHSSVYAGQTPSRYLASFAPFLHKHQDHPFIAGLLQREFTRFCENNLLMLKNAGSLPVHFIGSVAHHFQRHVKAALAKAGLPTGTFQQDPIAGMIAYHTGER